MLVCVDNRHSFWSPAVLGLRHNFTYYSQHFTVFSCRRHCLHSCSMAKWGKMPNVACWSENWLVGDAVDLNAEQAATIWCLAATETQDPNWFTSPSSGLLCLCWGMHSTEYKPAATTDTLKLSEWVSESAWGLTSPSTQYRSFWRRVFPVNHLHWYWQPNQNNQETEHTNNTTQKGALVNSKTDTLKKI